MEQLRPHRRKGPSRHSKGVVLPIEGMPEVPFRFSDRLYLETLSRLSGQGPLVGPELGRSVKLLAEAHRKTSAYAYKNCLIGIRFDGDELVYCGRRCNPRNHTIQKNGVLSALAAKRGDDLRVLRLTLNVMDVQEATRKDYPTKEFHRTTRPMWRVSRISPEEQPINGASCAGFACPECDKRVFSLIDKFPPLGNLHLPAEFEENCEDCLTGRLASPDHVCLGKWMSELAYRSCHYKRNCICGLLDALSDARKREVESGHQLSVEMLDSYVTDLSKQVEVLDRYLLLFEQRRLLSRGPTMCHHILEFQSAVDVASSNFLGVLNGSAPSTYFAINLYPLDRRQLAFVSYFDSDRGANRQQVDRILDGLEKENPVAPGELLREILGTWENAFARPDDYYQLPNEVKEDIEKVRTEDGIGKSFGFLFRYLEKSAKGREMLSQLRKLAFSPRLPKSRYF